MSTPASCGQGDIAHRSKVNPRWLGTLIIVECFYIALKALAIPYGNIAVMAAILLAVAAANVAKVLNDHASSGEQGLHVPRVSSRPGWRLARRG
jgi:hypothetical protein